MLLYRVPCAAHFVPPFPKQGRKTQLSPLRGVRRGQAFFLAATDKSMSMATSQFSALTFPDTARPPSSLSPALTAHGNICFATLPEPRYGFCPQQTRHAERQRKSMLICTGRQASENKKHPRDIGRIESCCGRTLHHEPQPSQKRSLDKKRRSRMLTAPLPVTADRRRVFAGQRSSQRLRGRPGGKNAGKRTGEDEKQVVPRGVKRASQRQNFREPVEFGLSRLEHRKRISGG